ncbi:hypothetical protein PENSPDRAFT_611087 [Peniophora sp. CONT]|nr:hypothetical protein PENSPDRAFT_611087 [Peniophora sp. CONT]
MALFSDLPVDLLPLILEQILKASHLGQICLVNKVFYEFSVSQLYSRIIIRHWYHDVKSKVICLFRTLAEHEHLALMVRQLEVGDFPKGLHAEQDDALRESCIRGLQNARHLRAVTWTRDGSLTSEILQALAQCTELRSISMNGNSSGHYDPRELLNLTQLNSVSVVMPGSGVIDIFPSWMQVVGQKLRSLTLICKDTRLVNDALLEDMSAFLPSLERLSLVGCPKVTHRGIGALVRQNVRGLLSLGLEGITPAFDVSSFGAICSREGGLVSLQSFTFTFEPGLLNDAWINGIVSLLSVSPLDLFQAYATDRETALDAPMVGVLIDRIVRSHGQRLTRLSVHRARLRLHTIEGICTTCPNLRQLFMLIDYSDLPQLGPVLAKARQLNAVHVNISELPVPYEPNARAMALLSQCSPTVTQFGIDNRVWQIARHVEVQADGQLTTRPVLTTYENPDIPEQFLVVRA